MGILPLDRISDKIGNGEILFYHSVKWDVFHKGEGNMDIGKTSGASFQNISGHVKVQRESVQAETRTDEFTPSKKQEPPLDKGKMNSIISQIVMDKDLKSAFELRELWAVPRRGGICPHPNVGPNGEVNASTFGDFTVLKDGKEVISIVMEDASQKHPGLKTLAVNRPPAFSNDGKAYVPDRSGRLHAYDLNSGKPLWEFSTRAEGGVTSPVIGKNDEIYIRDGEGNLYSLDRNSGKLSWALKKWAFAFKEEKNSLKPPENHPPALSKDGTLFVVGKKGVVYAVCSDTGKLKKDFEPFEAGESIYYSFSPFCDGKGNLFIPLREEKSPSWKIACIDGNTGKKMWESPTGENMVAPVCMPDGTILVGTTGGTWITKDNKGENQKIMALNPDTGELQWEIPINGRIEGITLDPGGQKLAVLHSKTTMDAWDEPVFIDNISLINTSTHILSENVKPATSEKDGIHSISFAPDGSLIAYAYPDTVKAFALKDNNLYTGKDGLLLTHNDIEKLSKDDKVSGSSLDSQKEIIIDDNIINFDGIKLTRKDGRFKKL